MKPSGPLLPGIWAMVASSNKEVAVESISTPDLMVTRVVDQVVPRIVGRMVGVGDTVQTINRLYLNEL